MPHGGTRDTTIDLLSWSIVALAGLVTFTQAVGWAATRIIAVLQSLTPYFAFALVPVVLVGLWRRRLLLVTVASAVGFGIGMLAVPLAFPDPQPVAAADSIGLRVASLNLWYENPRIDDVGAALDEVDADVIVFIEFTPAHQAALLGSDLADSYEFRTDRNGSGPTGIAIWSRWPFRIGPEQDTANDSLDVSLDGPDGEVRIIGMHMPTPIDGFDAWRHDLHLAAEIGRATDAPTLLIGDLNSSYWHPDFRRLLDAGYVDADVAAGSGFSTSWPTDWWIPPFVRLDHALTIGGLVSTDIDDLDIPGSDHLGLVVTVAPAR